MKDTAFDINSLFSKVIDKNKGQQANSNKEDEEKKIAIEVDPNINNLEMYSKITKKISKKIKIDNTEKVMFQFLD